MVMARTTKPSDTDAKPPADNTLPLPEQTFFADPALDRLMGVTMALAAEVYMLRSRVRKLEQLQLPANAAAAGSGMSAEQADAGRADAAAFAAHLLQPLLGEQQARGPL